MHVNSFFGHSLCCLHACGEHWMDLWVDLSGVHNEPKQPHEEKFQTSKPKSHPKKYGQLIWVSKANYQFTKSNNEELNIPSVTRSHFCFLWIYLRIDVECKDCSNYYPSNKESQRDPSQVSILISMFRNIELCVIDHMFAFRASHFIKKY